MAVVRVIILGGNPNGNNPNNPNKNQINITKTKEEEFKQRRRESQRRHYEKKGGRNTEELKKHSISEANRRAKWSSEQKDEFNKNQRERRAALLNKKTWSELTYEEKKKISVEIYLTRWPKITPERKTELIGKIFQNVVWSNFWGAKI